MNGLAMQFSQNNQKLDLNPAIAAPGNPSSLFEKPEISIIQPKMSKSDLAYITYSKRLIEGKGTCRMTVSSLPTMKDYEERRLRCC